MFTFIELPTFASVRDRYLDDEEFDDRTGTAETIARGFRK
jgi:hypothetical protein